MLTYDLLHRHLLMLRLLNCLHHTNEQIAGSLTRQTNLFMDLPKWHPTNTQVHIPIRRKPN